MHGVFERSGPGSREENASKQKEEFISRTNFPQRKADTSGFYGELAETMCVVAACLPKLRSTAAGIQSARS
jgi:hypothetical protein